MFKKIFVKKALRELRLSHFSEEMYRKTGHFPNSNQLVVNKKHSFKQECELSIKHMLCLQPIFLVYIPVPSPPEELLIISEFRKIFSEFSIISQRENKERFFSFCRETSEEIWSLITLYSKFLRLSREFEEGKTKEEKNVYKIQS